MKSRGNAKHRKRRQLFRCPALRIDQDPKHPLYVFAVTGEQLWKIASISHIGRTGAGKLIGYQRPAVKRHIHSIVEYLDHGPALLPNSLVVALSSDVRFIRSGRGRKSESAVHGILEIPLPTNGDPRPGWIVDGQQRALALAQAKRRDLLVPVNAFVADDAATQREQFLRVNSVKPLPRGLATELLPDITGVLPANLTKRRAASALCDLLNNDQRSPLYGMIRRASLTPENAARAVVSDTTIVQVLQDSLATPAGCLFSYWNVATGELHWAAARRVLFVYWSAVRDVFPEAWGLPPSRSRLMHSAGLRAMGRLMNRVMASVDASSPQAVRHTRRELEKVSSACHWTRGTWDELGGLRWNELQNIPSHVRMLSNLLVRRYVEATG
jgi:DGQHR domain-containing protein